MKPLGRTATVVDLGVGQTLGYASTYYLPALLAVPTARDLGIAPSMVFAAFSAALLVAAAVGPWAGRAVDRHGGRPVLAATSLVFAGGLALLALAQDPWSLFAAWFVLGIGMASGLYEVAFATVVRLYGRDSRGAITGITLIAGLASTVGWPLTAWLEARWGWRGACWTWAALHLLLGLPLNLLLPRAGKGGPASSPAPGTPPPQVSPDRARPGPSAAVATALLAFIFAVTWFISTAMAAHLPRLLQAGGAAPAAAVAYAALVGPAQVAGRLLEFGLLRRVHPLLSARLAALGHAAGAVAFLLVGAPAAAVFAVLHGAGNGVLTIAKGTLPLLIFGPSGYGMRQGLLMAPAHLAQAAAPLLFGLCVERFGVGALWVSSGIGLAGFVALLALSAGRAVDPARQRPA